MIDTEFDSQQIEGAFPQYKFEKRLGRGAYGKVFLVSERATGEQFAVKKISCFGMCEYQRNNAVNEVRILASLDHPSIIQFKSGMFDNNEDDLYLFMEYAPEGDLARLIETCKESKKRFSQQMIWNVVLQLAEGLEYLHRHNIIHRDIKPANIFRSGRSYKLADMNVSKVMSQGSMARTKAGSPLYVAPEVWREEGYDEKCDIYSLGVVIYEMCCQKVPYQADNIDELIRKQKHTRIVNIPYYFSPDLNELVHEMLHFSPKRRISAEKVRLVCLKHLKIDSEESINLLDPLINTIVIPEGEQRWVNLVPLPPKGKKEGGSTIQRRDSREKQRDKEPDMLPNRSNIFVSLENKSILVPKARNGSQEKGSRAVRLPSIHRKGSGIRDNQSRVRLPSRERSLSKHQSRITSSRSKSREATRAQTPERQSSLSKN